LPARNPKDVLCPMVEKLWRVVNGGRSLSCELRQDSAGWDVLMRSDDEALFSRRCADEAEARFVADGLKQDELNAGWSEVAPG
jgi:hypothetical protein